MRYVKFMAMVCASYAITHCGLSKFSSAPTPTQKPAATQTQSNSSDATTTFTAADVFDNGGSNSVTNTNTSSNTNSISNNVKNINSNTQTAAAVTVTQTWTWSGVPVVTPTNTNTVIDAKCGGKIIDNYCFYNPNLHTQSCLQFCQGNGHGDAIDYDTYAGARGSDANCSKIITSFGYQVNMWPGLPFPTASEGPSAPGGCSISPQPYRAIYPPFNKMGYGRNIESACACAR